jgi:hypothetical protein
MKLIMVVVLLVIAGVGYYLITDSGNNTPELTQEILETPTPYVEKVASSAPSININSDEVLIEVSKALNLKSTPDELANMQSLLPQSQLTNNIIGYYDPNAIAPEDESVQMFYSDGMDISEPLGIAPESGNEMMPLGDGNPLMSEPIADSISPESPNK